jgi:U2 small nuclear ribonucleoprotein A'
LYLNNNRIARIGKNMDEQLPMLKCVILTNNRLGKLADVDPLATFKRLTHLSLMNNPVTRAENYRAYVIYKLKKLKVLDFRKVKPKEREAAEELFGGDEGEAAMEAAKTFVPRSRSRTRRRWTRWSGWSGRSRRGCCRRI